MRFFGAAFCAVLLSCDSGGLRLGEPPQVTRTSPSDGELGVSRRPTFQIFFDRTLNPASVNRASVALRSGETRVFLSPRIEPVTRSILARQLFASPLVQGVQYTLEVEGVEALDGTPMEPLSVDFVTGESEMETQDPVPNPGEVLRIFQNRCSSGSCHGGESPRLGLDLSSAEAISRTAIGIPSALTVSTGHAPAGLTGMPRIEVVGGRGRPSRSYLLYKILDDPLIVGQGMPIDGALTQREMQEISNWILAGAPLEQ